MTTQPDHQQTLREFRDVVNMTSAALRHWLESDDSKSVCMTEAGERVTEPGQAESVGHHMGQRILELMQQRKVQLTPAEYADMGKVVGYVHRHMAQRPSGDIEGSRWRKSLTNWGHNSFR